MNTVTTKRYRLLINLPDGAIIGDTYKKVGDRYFNESLDAIKSPVVEHNSYFTWQVENCPTYFEEVLHEPVKEDDFIWDDDLVREFAYTFIEQKENQVAGESMMKKFKQSKQSPPLSEIKEGEDKLVLFTTEDGIGMTYGMDYWWVDTLSQFDYYIPHNAKVSPNSSGNYNESIKKFSTKEAAEQYIIDNKPCLSLNDVMKFVEPACHPSEENFDEIGLRDFVTKKLKSLNP